MVDIPGVQGIVVAVVFPMVANVAYRSQVVGEEMKLTAAMLWQLPQLPHYPQRPPWQLWQSQTRRDAFAVASPQSPRRSAHALRHAGLT
jgi:hypothetical protein